MMRLITIACFPAVHFSYYAEIVPYPASESRRAGPVEAPRGSRYPAAVDQYNPIPMFVLPGCSGQINPYHMIGDKITYQRVRN